MFRLLFLRLIHYTIALGEFVCGILKFVPQYGGYVVKRRRVSAAEADAKQLSKLPLHMGVVLVEKDYSLRDLANVVLWSVTMGIFHVTIYDVNGEVKRSSQGLSKALEQSIEVHHLQKGAGHDIQIFIPSPHGSQQIGVGQGSKKASVHLLSAEDGCQAMVQVAWDLSRRVAAKQLVADDISPSIVTQSLHETHGFPDPDLILKFGSTHSLMGYLPWQTRLSEIISVPSHKGLKYQDFLASLQCYAGTQQRFGK